MFLLQEETFFGSCAKNGSYRFRISSVKEIGDIIVKREKGDFVYLRDVAEVVNGYEEVESYARLNKQPVVSLNIVKKGGENLLEATDKIMEILSISKQTIFFLKT